MFNVQLKIKAGNSYRLESHEVNASSWWEAVRFITQGLELIFVSKKLDGSFFVYAKVAA